MNCLLRKVTWILLLSPILFLGCLGGLSLESKASGETELTPEFVADLEPKLSSPRLTGQLEILDKLIYGKGDYLRVEGKSRRCVVLLLDKYGKFFIKLFDLPESQLKDATARGLVHFTGVFSKVERSRNGLLEISVTYSFLSPKPDLFFTAQARTFARRVEDQKAKNRELLTAAGPRAETPESPKPATPVEPQARREPAMPAAETDDRRPALIRRGSPPGDSATSQSPPVASQESPAKKPPIGSDQDNVIYRRPKSEAGNEPPSRNRSAPAVNPSNVKLSPEYQQGHEVEGMVLVPAGYVTMGSDDRGDNEKPVHRVQIGAFYMDKYEVTNLEYQKFCAATGRPMPVHWKDGKYPAGQERHPVVQLTWQDALAYSRWAGKRLPTEAEWERAAKGPNSTRYAYGNAYDPTKGNTNSPGTKPVGSTPMNGFGLYDMTGNVSEWTSTLFMQYPYKADDGREDGQASGARVVRGGNYTSGEKDSRCLHRTSLAPDQIAPTLGFRCARDAD